MALNNAKKFVLLKMMKRIKENVHWWLSNSNTEYAHSISWGYIVGHDLLIQIIQWHNEQVRNTGSCSQ